MAEEFKSRRGYDVMPFLPFLGTPDTYPAGDVPAWPSVPAPFAGQVNNDFSEVLTQLYCEYHLAGLEEMAERHGKTIRYQVAYNKPFEEERCGLFVGIPENEAYGRPQLDGQRLMAGAAHLGRKPRYSFECAAETGHSYGQSYEDLLWWVKRSLMAGMNAQVLHGASYSGALTGSDPGNMLSKYTGWPGYAGFGIFVSNNWNRTPDIAHARGCLDAVSRLNTVFRQRAKVDLAVFRQSYCNDGTGPEFMNYPDDGALLKAGYSYDFLSEYLLNLPAARMEEGQLDRDGAAYQALVVPPQERMSYGVMCRILSLAAQGLPVVLVGEAPSSPLCYSECRSEASRKAWEERRDMLWYSPAENVLRVASLSEVSRALAVFGVRPRVALSGDGLLCTAFRREDSGRVWAAVYAPNSVREGEAVAPGNADMTTVRPVYRRPGTPSEREVEVSVTGYGEVYRFDCWTGGLSPAGFVYTGKGQMRGRIRLQEDEMVLLCLDSMELPEERMEARTASEEEKAGELCLKEVRIYAFEPETEGEISFLRSGFSKEPVYTCAIGDKDALVSWHEMDEALLHVSGKGVYTGELTLFRAPSAGERLVLELGDVYDTFSVRVNGQEAPFGDQVMKRIDLTGLLRQGVNDIEITVVSELYNRVVGTTKPDPRMPFEIPFLPRPYGITASPDRRFGLYRV